MNAYVHDIEHHSPVGDDDDLMHDFDALRLHMPVSNEEGDIVSAADLDFEPTDNPDGYELDERDFLAIGLGSGVTAMMFETANEQAAPVTRIGAGMQERHERVQDWQSDLVRMQNLGLDVFSAEDYTSLTVKDADIFQRVLRNARRSALNRAKRIKLVEGDLALDPDLESIYGKSRSASELLSMADQLEQLVADIDTSGLIDEKVKKSKKGLDYARRNYSDIVVVKDETGRLRVTPPSLRSTA